MTRPKSRIRNLCDNELVGLVVEWLVDTAPATQTGCASARRARLALEELGRRVESARVVSCCCEECFVEFEFPEGDHTSALV